MKMTPWYRSHIKPVHVGEYEICNEGIRAWWTGEHWTQWYFEKIHPAARDYRKTKVSNQQGYEWRGISKE